MFDYRGQPVEEAAPSTPVSVMGLGDVPPAGELFQVVESDKHARAIAARRKTEEQEARTARKSTVTLEQIFDQFQAGKVRELRLIIKADVQGSLEPIVSSLEEMSDTDISINILQAGTGNITESDVMLAVASKAVVLGFNVQPDGSAERLAETEGVSIRLYEIIYRLTEDIEKALKGMLEPEEKEVVIGKAEVRAVFRISKVGKIAGCIVRDGELRRNATIRVMREEEVVAVGPVSSLKHLQDDVKEVRQGFECGVGVKGFDSFEDGDVLECFIIEIVPV
jgi:translation initiation factor IF-2